jgi:hypothetical protein
VSGQELQRGGRLGFAVDLLLGWVVAALIAMTIVYLSATIVPDDDTSSLPITVPRSGPELTDDLDPRDPLVECTMYEAHTRCIREPR